MTLQFNVLYWSTLVITSQKPTPTTNLHNQQQAQRPFSKQNKHQAQPKKTKQQPNTTQQKPNTTKPQQNNPYETAARTEGRLTKVSGANLTLSPPAELVYLSFICCSS